MQSRFLQATNNYYMWISTHAPITSILENVHSPFSYLLCVKRLAFQRIPMCLLLFCTCTTNVCMYLVAFFLLRESLVTKVTSTTKEYIQTLSKYYEVNRFKILHIHTCIYNIKSNNHIEHLTTDTRVGDESQCMDSASS